MVACCDEPKVNESTDKSTAALSSTNSFLSVIYLFFYIWWDGFRSFCSPQMVKVGKSEAKVESYVMSEVRTYHQKYPEKLKEEVSESSEDQGNFHGK